METIERQNYIIEQADWDRIVELSRNARNAPMIALSSADALAGRDFSSMAHQRLMDEWKTLGQKYKFDPKSVVRVDESHRLISAYPMDKEIK